MRRTAVLCDKYSQLYAIIIRSYDTHLGTHETNSRWYSPLSGTPQRCIQTQLYCICDNYYDVHTVHLSRSDISAGRMLEAGGLKSPYLVPLQRFGRPPGRSFDGPTSPLLSPASYAAGGRGSAKQCTITNFSQKSGFVSRNSLASLSSLCLQRYKQLYTIAPSQITPEKRIGADLGISSANCPP